MNRHVNSPDGCQHSHTARTLGPTVAGQQPGDRLAFRHLGTLESPDAHGQVTGRCGETIEFFIKVKEDRVSEVSFVTDGCNASRLCGSMAAQMALGQSLDAVADITGDMVLKNIDSYPIEENHCAYVAAGALQDALHKYMVALRGGLKASSIQPHIGQPTSEGE